jgi:Uma2 family endonuclease
MSATLITQLGLSQEDQEDGGLHLRLWTCDEYQRAADLGVFGEDEHLELLDGEVYRRMSPHGSPHVTAVLLIQRHFVVLFEDDLHHVRSQAPTILSLRSEPEPDILIVKGGVLDFASRHPGPADISLLVEVSDSTLAIDRNKKARIYAEAGIADYWIVNLRERCLEVRREPSPGNASYKHLITLTAGDVIAPLFAPETEISVASLLPPPLE